jgi:hypothetical protein
LSLKIRENSPTLTHISSPTLSNRLDNYREDDYADIDNADIDNTDDLIDMDASVITYVPPHQQALLDILPHRYAHSFMEAIIANEQRHAPSPNSSRLLAEDKLGIEVECVAMLAQRTTSELRSILENDPRGLNDLRQPDRRILSPDPVIYINYLVTRDRKGFPIGEYKTLLAGLMLGAGLPMPPELDGIITTPMEEFTRRIRIAYSTLGKTRTFFDTTHNSFEGHVRELVDYHLHVILPDAERQRRLIDGVLLPVTHILLPGEVGLASWGYDRCDQHRKWKGSSPDHFRLIQIVARILWPNDGWDLYQVFVFEMIRHPQAAIGESLASVLCGSYKALGGVNVQQAGKSQTGITAIDENGWTGAILRARDSHTWTNMQENLRAMEQRVEVAILAQNQRRYRQERQQEYDQLQAETFELWEELTASLDEAHAQDRTLGDKLHEVQDRIKTDQEQKEKLDRADEAAERLWDALKTYR